jgi:dolichol kinase
MHNAMTAVVAEPVMACRTKLQWGRKVMHAMTGVIGMWLYAYLAVSKGFMLWFVGSLLTVAFTLELLRRASHHVNCRVCRYFKGVMRERERQAVTSATWFLASMFVVFAFFPRDIAVLSLLFIGLGDPAAGTVGARWGRHRINTHVSVEGSLAAFAVCALGTWLLAATALNLSISGGALAIFVVLAGLIGMTSEATFKQFDDNLVMPLVSAPLLLGLTYLL